MKDLNITTTDLNGVDYLNGSSSGHSKGGTPVVNDSGDGLKGALSKYSNQVQGMSFTIDDEKAFLFNLRNQILEFQLEQFEYDNLPDGLDKYRVEVKNMENGVVGITRFDDTYYAVSVTEKDFNIYDEPSSVIITEPKSSLNGRELKVGSDIVLIRNNIKKIPSLNKVWRFLINIEKVLFQIEKNVVASAPKGIINLKNTQIDVETDSPYKTSMELVINGEDTFYVVKGLPASEQDPNNENPDSLFIPIELKDRTNELIINYSFMKENIKEMVGAGTNMLNGKRERLITGEMETQQDFSNYTLDHMLKIRQLDIENVNKIFGLDIKIKLSKSEKTKMLEEVEDENTTEPKE